ncbi:DUF5060 domain-containing protein [Anditalea andensis]|nr:DUF5060 domain-containing protein [Anditalea andensis]
MKFLKILLLIFISSYGVLMAQEEVEKWGVFELVLEGSDVGNPFLETDLHAVFFHKDTTFSPEGFYDGNGVFKIRFMPTREGTWTYKTFSNQEELEGNEGEFFCTPAGSENHGRVKVAEQYHFEYEDGTEFMPFGTTIYEWTFQNESTKAATIETLKNNPFNKARFLAIPPHKEKYIDGGELHLKDYPFEDTGKEDWDFTRFNPEFFKNLDECITRLNEIGVEADLVLFHPYDKGKWGFDMMGMENNLRYVRYMMARYAAYKNIWWSLANENSFIKDLDDEDWDILFKEVQEKDPYGHLRSIHNAGRIYDYNRPWVTHVSLQYYNAVRVPGVSPLLRDIYRKPIVHDEINYEGDIEKRWGRISAEELVFRFWNAAIGGAYATHGESYEESDWISHGGTLIGESPARIEFMKNLMADKPWKWNPIDQYYELNMAGKAGLYYLIYFGEEALEDWAFVLPNKELKSGAKFKVEIIDTWGMTVVPVDQVFEVVPLEGDGYKVRDKDNAVISLPGQKYIALRIQRIKD